MADHTEALKRLEDSKRSKFINTTSVYLGISAIIIIIVLMFSKHHKIHIIISSVCMIIVALLSLKKSHKAVCIALMILDGLIAISWAVYFSMHFYRFSKAFIFFINNCYGEKCSKKTSKKVKKTIVAMVVMPVSLIMIYYLLSLKKATYKYWKSLKEIENAKSN
ncbi:hypothetical protein SteCoe_16695 [Stentor coeruleus]|uniref:Uncharacterized protein n=1 Tax=Stentor coeruleus TaxID=5963 RepID=A0A1R2C0Q1_9CILI|nr:hypothetical protein SteCoe_16695 [Stentor coeruleus]